MGNSCIYLDRPKALSDEFRYICLVCLSLILPLVVTPSASRLVLPPPTAMDHLCPRECFSRAVCLVCFSRPDTELDTYVQPRTVGLCPPASGLRLTSSHPDLRTSAIDNHDNVGPGSRTIKSATPSSLPIQQLESINESPRPRRSLFQLMLTRLGSRPKKSSSLPPNHRLRKAESHASLTSPRTNLYHNDSAVDLLQLSPKIMAGTTFDFETGKVQGLT